MTSLLRIALAVFVCVSCARRAPIESVGSTATSDASGAQVIPTIYLADRFFATTATARGDSVTLFLDTGDESRVWSTFAARVGMTTEAIRVNGRDVRAGFLPEFRAGHRLPPPSVGTGRVIVTPPQDHFDTLMSSHADGQLGVSWFADRVWTFDYPGHRLLLRAGSAASGAVDAHETPVGFATDSTGRRLDHAPRIAVVIDGDSINMLFDTGATVWLPAAALAAVNDGGPQERASSLIWGWMFDRWRRRHPDWRVVDSADVASNAPMIQVPNVRIAGFDVGPVWFRSLTQASTVPPPIRRDIPFVATRINGTIGGNVLRQFVVTLDYPRATATFVRPARSG